MAMVDETQIGPVGAALGRAIRRLRVLRGMKQATLAELAGVTQATVSRWERGSHRPTPEQAARALDALAARLDDSADRALRRLVETSPWPVHLICDATHRLLAASPARTRGWGQPATFHIGRSLWRFATEQIQAAESALAGLAWHQRLDAAAITWTDGNRDPDVRIRPGWMLWEPLLLSNGTRARLVTSMPYARLRALLPDAAILSRPPE